MTLYTVYFVFDSISIVVCVEADNEAQAKAVARQVAWADLGLSERLLDSANAIDIEEG